MDQIRQIAGDGIERMTAVVVVPGLLNFRVGSNWMTQQVEIVGIDDANHGNVSDYAQYLQHPENRRQFAWQLREDGYDVRDHQSSGTAPERKQMRDAGWVHRRRWAEARQFEERLFRQSQPDAQAGNRGNALAAGPTAEAAPVAPAHPAATTPLPNPNIPLADPFAGKVEAANPGDAVLDPGRQQHTGAVVGIAMASFRGRDGADRFVILPGDDVKITFPTVGTPPKAIGDEFTVVDLYESKMSEYDSRFVFVPIRKLQELRGMMDPTTHIGMFNSIQIKLKPGVSGEAVRDKLAAVFPEELYVVSTWRDKQGPLLAAVQMETAILNVLLFLIIAVAGFGILAIFYMIVVEKTRDIGILKSLGAPGQGVMGIFLSYGLSLGVVGSGVGMLLGLLFVRYINQIADFLSWLTGQKVFDPAIYYFYSIPAIVEPRTVASIVAGALLIAVAASVLPALRAARLHPVEALRYE
jgi:lipoprotein-releasing system permease protein